jgi:hypothetical protein
MDPFFQFRNTIAERLSELEGYGEEKPVRDVNPK